MLGERALSNAVETNQDPFVIKKKEQREKEISLLPFLPFCSPLCFQPQLERELKDLVATT